MSYGATLILPNQLHTASPRKVAVPTVQFGRLTVTQWLRPLVKENDWSWTPRGAPRPTRYPATLAPQIARAIKAIIRPRLTAGETSRCRH